MPHEILADQFVVLNKEQREYLVRVLDGMQSLETPVAEWTLQRSIVAALEEAGE